MKKTISLLVSLSLMIVLVSCDEDDTEKGESLVSQYVIKSAILANDVTTSLPDVSMDAGTDITTAIVKSFLDEISCLDNSGKALELTEDNKILYLCRFEDKSQEQGSWSVNEDRTSLTLTLNIQGNLVPLILTNLEETKTSVNGTVDQIPVPPSLLSFVDGEFLKVPDPAVLIAIDLNLDKLD